MTDFIALQKRADEAAVQLRRDGYKDAAMLILELRRVAYEKEATLNRVRWAIQPE